MAAKPPSLPSWMTVDKDGIQPEQLGNAWADQYTTGGWGAYNDPLRRGDYWNGSMGALPIGTERPSIGSSSLPNAATREAVALRGALGGGMASGPVGPLAPGFHSPQSGYSPSAGMTGMREDGTTGSYEAPGVGTRVGRAAKGFLTGPDTGSAAGNAGLRAGGAVLGSLTGTPIGLGIGAAGAAKGAMDDSPVFRPGDYSATSSSTKSISTAPREKLLSGGGYSGGLSGFGGAGLAGGTLEGTTPVATQQPGATQGEGFGWAPGGPADPGFAANPIEGRPPAAEANGLPAQSAALAGLFSGGQSYATDGAGGRRGVAGAGGGYEFAGFDFAQDPSNRDIGKSAKYAFSHFASQAAARGVPQPRTKAEAEQWFATEIAPGMNELGFTVHKVVGDKAFISAPEHPQGAWVDFVIGADGTGATPLAWQAELGGAGADMDPEALFAPTSSGGGGEPFGMARGASPSGVMDSGNSSLDSFADTLIKQLLAGAALEDTVGSGRTTRGITPAGLKAVGF